MERDRLGEGESGTKDPGSTARTVIGLSGSQVTVEGAVRRDVGANDRPLTGRCHLLCSWESFYVIVGSAGGALTR